MRFPNHDQQQGLTLTELLVAVVIAGLISLLTARIMIENAESNARAETRRRLLGDWNRATNLLQEEISMSQSIITEADDQEPIMLSTEGCPWLEHRDAALKLQLHLTGTLPDVIYGIRSIASLEAEDPSEQDQWIGGGDAGVLIRCGPELVINPDGSTTYNQGGPYQQSIMIDDLDMSVENGMRISQSQSNNQSVNFELALKGKFKHQENQGSSSFQLGSSGLSRINDVPPIPSERSACEKVCQVIDQSCGPNVTTILPGDPADYVVAEKPFGTSTYCTNRPLQQNQRINGVAEGYYVQGNYVMDGNPTPGREPENSTGITLRGGDGRNILLGTSNNDELRGGPDHDAVIGRGGSDDLRGLEGDDSFIPFSDVPQRDDQVIVDGGGGLDRVYFQQKKANYIVTDCRIESCTISLSKEGATAHLSNVEQLVFKDQNIKLSQ